MYTRWLSQVANYKLQTSIWFDFATIPAANAPWLKMGIQQGGGGWRGVRAKKGENITLMFLLSIPNQQSY